MHLPLEMGCVVGIMAAVAKAYPRAVIGENGVILEHRRPDGGNINQDEGAR